MDKKIVIDSSVILCLEERAEQLISLSETFGGLSTSYLVYVSFAKDRFSQSIGFEWIEEIVEVDRDQDFEAVYLIRNGELKGLGLSDMDCSVLELARRTHRKLLTCNNLMEKAARRMQIELAEFPYLDFDVTINEYSTFFVTTNSYEIFEEFDFELPTHWEDTIINEFKFNQKIDRKMR